MASEIKKFEESTLDLVLNKVNNFREMGELKVPADYSAENAIRSAWLILQDAQNKPLENCTKESIANSLLNMVIQGLSPVKKQCDFIAYGNKLVLQREYHGSIALARRYGNMKDVYANVIYKDDTFEYFIDPVTARKSVVKHEQKLQNMDNTKIIGAYAVVVFNDNSTAMEAMTLPQIQKSWEQGATKGNSPAHKNFPDEMCKKTVINRALKLIISGSSDSALFSDDDLNDKVLDQAQSEIKSRANRQTLSIQVSSNEDAAEIVQDNAQLSAVAVKEYPEQKEELVLPSQERAVSIPPKF